jgi:phosphoadenosine phosphosulfate reductase
MMMSNVLVYETWDQSIANEFEKEHLDYFDVLKWSYRTYGDKLVYACSFGAEGIVMIDLISKVNRQAEVIFLDTGLHFKETYDVINKVRKKYPELNIRLLQPELSVDEQAVAYGEKLWVRDPNLCCHMRKIVPLTQALKGKKAWISGLRKEQSPTRQHINFLNKDDKLQLIKICPLKDWTWEDVWTYIKVNNLPYNSLHDAGYPSIGCKTCTLPVIHSTDLRSGRWAHFEKTECGLHQSR